MIVTADDFGLSIPVNAAVEDAHRRGILTAASLMVGAEAAADAVARSRKLPSLAVGLHLVIVDGRPILPAARIPDLLDRHGLLSSRLGIAGCRYFFLPGVRRQLEAEIRAQFQAFQETGLELDHVNAHHHMHLHPTVLELIVRIGRDYGLQAVRLPSESILADGGLNWPRVLLAPWIAWMRWRIRRAGLRYNGLIFGLRDTGRMDAERLLEIIRRLPEGDSEVFMHPASGARRESHQDIDRYRGEQEYQALIDPRAAEIIREQDIRLITFRELALPGPG